MKNKELYKKIKLIFVTLFITLCLSINLEGDTFNGNHVLYIGIAVLLWETFSKIVTIQDKRARVCCLILASIFAICELLGTSIMKYNNLSLIIGSKMAILKSSLKFAGYVAIFYSVSLLLFTKLIPKIRNLKIKQEEWKFFTNNKKSFFIVVCLILIAYLPFFLHEYPGIISVDVTSEMQTGMYRINEMVNHHPVFHIFILSIFMNIGKLLGNYNLAIGLFSMCQIIFTACTFSYVIYYMAKKRVNKWIRLIATLFFMFYQPFASYSITLWKDIPFSLMIVWLTIGMIEIATNKEFFQKITNIIRILIISIFVILFKNNGIYIVAMCLPFIIFFAKQNRKRAVMFSILIIALYILWKGPIFSFFNITDGPIREALSVPCQQIARVVKYEEISEEDKQRINKFLPVDEIGEAYYPLISDNVKDKLNNENVKENKLEFIALWVELFFKHPRAYIESFLSGSYGYWYPEAENWIIWGGYNLESFEWARESLNVEINKEPILKSKFVEILKAAPGCRDIPIIGMLYSIGFIAWLEITVLIYIVYKKEYRLLLAFIPVFGVWLTCIASPVWCEFRYAYGLFTTLPIIMVLALNKMENIKEEG